MVHFSGNAPFYEHGVFWVFVAFVIFFAIFGRRLWLALAEILDRRAEAIRSELEEAARLRREAEQMLRDATARREQAIAEAQEMIARAEAEARRAAEATRREAEAAARRHERSAQDRISAAEKAVVSELRSRAAVLAAEAAGRVIAEDHDREADAPLRDRAIASLPGALARHRDARHTLRAAG